MSYQPGIHLLADMTGCATQNLQSYEGLKSVLEQQISKFRLQSLGTVYHNFQPQGFTAVVCLSESHISIHTWPEYGRVNMDIYLSNYERNNDGTVRQLFDALHEFFQPTHVDKKEVVR